MHISLFAIATTITAGSIISIVLDASSPKFRRIGGSSANYYYHVIPIAVAQSGMYTFTSGSNISTIGFVYTNSFDRENPESNLLAADYGSDGGGQYKISTFLQVTGQVSRKVSAVLIVSSNDSTIFHQNNCGILLSHYSCSSA